MERVTLTPANEADWLAMREQDVTSTESAALFTASPYMTTYELYFRKRGEIASTFEVNERMRWGNRLEAAIAAGIAEDYGLVIEPFKSYMRIPSLRMGSSFDYKIVGTVPGFTGPTDFIALFDEHGPGLMEVKNVDGLQFKRGWINDDEKEAPPHIEFQVQHQMEVSGLGWTIITPLVGGNHPVPFARLRDMATGNIIRSRVAAFWDRVTKGEEPEPDFARDGETIARRYLESNGAAVDMTTNNRLRELVQVYEEAGAIIRAQGTVKDAVKAEIITIIGGSEKIQVADGWKISAGTVKESLGTLITPDMVGQYVGGRKSYRNVRVYAPKQK